METSNKSLRCNSIEIDYSLSAQACKYSVKSRCKMYSRYLKPVNVTWISIQISYSRKKERKNREWTHSKFFILNSWLSTQSTHYGMSQALRHRTLSSHHNSSDIRKQARGHVALGASHADTRINWIICH